MGYNWLTNRRRRGTSQPPLLLSLHLLLLCVCVCLCVFLCVKRLVVSRMSCISGNRFLDVEMLR